MGLQNIGLVLLVLQGLVLTYSRRIRRHSETLESQSNFDSVDTKRFATLYHGKDWTEVTGLPRGWEIIDFGSPAPAHSARFQQARHNVKAPGDETGNLRCVESDDGKIQCGPPPSSKDPDHGIDEDEKQEAKQAEAKQNSINPNDSSGKEPTPPELNTAIDALKIAAAAPKAAPRQDATKVEATAPKVEATAPKALAPGPPNQPSSNPPQSSQKEDKKEQPQQVVKQQPAQQEVEKPAQDVSSQEKEYVVGGGFIISLEACCHACISNDQSEWTR